MATVERKTARGLVNGFSDPKFSGVVDAFVENFDKRGEIGAAIAITLDGKTVLDLWGGQKSDGGDSWKRDTICIVYSCTKGASAFCAHIAADRGLLDLDAAVAKYWPEFASNGKEGALVSMMLDHSVGVPGLREELKQGAYYDYAYMVERLAAEKPFWKPGTRNGYHGVTSAWTVGEMVHRSTGKRMGKFLADEIVKPLEIEFWMGLPEEYESRVSMMIAYPPDASVAGSRIALAIAADPMGPAGRFLLNGGGFNANDRAARAAEIGSATGVSNGRGLAGLYAPLANGGQFNGKRFVSADTLKRMQNVSVATHEDATLMIPTRFSLGYMKSMDNRKLDNAENCSAILSEPAFGHVGAGGSIGFADPEARMSFGYAMNKMGSGIMLNDRGQALVDATYRALGYRSNEGGVWTT